MQKEILYINMVLVSFLFTLQCAVASNVYRMSVSDQHDQEMGHASNCGKSTFGLIWTPKVIKPDDNVVVYLNFTAPYDMISGTVNASAFFRGDTDPFIAYVNPFSCQDLKDYFPCPVKKGESVSKRIPLPSVRSLSSYPGDYTVVAEVKNEKGQQMVCVKADVTIKV